MSNMRLTRLIKNYLPVVDLIWAIMIDVNVTQADRIQRIRKNFFELDLGSDQDFFESINWYAVKAINVCTKYSLACSRRCHFDNVRYWNQCITVISFVLGCSCTFDCWSTRTVQAHKLWCEYQMYYNAYVNKISAHEINLNHDISR